MKKFLLLFTCLLGMVGFASAEDSYTLVSSISSSNYEDGDITGVTGTNCATWTTDAFVMTQNKNSSSSAVSLNYEQIRFYVGHTLEFQAKEGYKITRVVGTGTNKKFGTFDDAVNCTYTEGSSSSPDYTITPTDGEDLFSVKSKAQTQFSKIVVYYEATTGVTVEKPTFNPDGGVVAVESTVAVTADAGCNVYVSTKDQLGTSTPTAEQVVAAGSSTKSFTITAPGTYFAVAVDGQGNKSSVAMATFDVVYNDGTEEHPYTVADAIKVANANGSSSDVNVYVEGYVCDTPTVNSDESYTFSIVGNENLEGDQLKAYKVTSDKAMDQGDKVVLYGPLCMFGTTNPIPEVNKGTVTSVTGKKDAEIAWSADAYIWKMGISTVDDLPTLDNPYNVGIEYTSSDTEVATITENGVVTIVGEGNTTITAAVKVNNTYKVSVVSYTLTVVDPTKIEDVLDVDSNWDPVFTNIYQSYTYTSANGVTYNMWAYKQNGFQLNNKGDNTASGIVVTNNANGYAVKSITIEPKTMGAELLVIGSNKAYTSTDDIKNASNRESDLGVVIGKIAKNNTTTVTITPDDEYRYICICPSASGADQLTSVTINWKEATPVATDVTVTIGESGYATLYYGEVNLTLPEGVDAYTYRVEGETAVADKTYEAGSVIPAGEAVLLAGAAGEYTLAVSATAGDKATVNCLRGTDEEALVEAGTDETLYILAKPANGPRGFYKASADGKSFTNNAHKAYLAVTTGASKAPKYIGLPNGGQSGIVNVIVDGDADANAPAYNVMGQKVTNDYKGFVIKNGKKMYNK